VNAADRLNQMIGLKLMAQGRLAEMAGPDVIDIDIYMRTLNLEKISTLLYGKYSDERKTLFESYSKSVWEDQKVFQKRNQQQKKSGQFP